MINTHRFVRIERKTIYLRSRSHSLFVILYKQQPICTVLRIPYNFHIRYMGLGNRNNSKTTIKCKTPRTSTQWENQCGKKQRKQRLKQQAEANVNWTHLWRIFSSACVCVSVREGECVARTRQNWRKKGGRDFVVKMRILYCESYTHSLYA